MYVRVCRCVCVCLFMSPFNVCQILLTPCRFFNVVSVLQAFVASQSPMKAIAQPEDTAHMVLGVLQSRFVTGQVVVVDGGYSLMN